LEIINDSANNAGQVVNKKCGVLGDTKTHNEFQHLNADGPIKASLLLFKELNITYNKI
jgi:hypothetical protein